MSSRTPLTLALLALFAASPALAAAPDPYKMPPAPKLPDLRSVPAPVPGVFVETATEKPRLAIIFDGNPPEFAKQLGDSLDRTRRFAVVAAPGSLVQNKPKLAPGLSLQDAQKIRATTKIDMAVVCTSKYVTSQLTAAARLADLRTGEVSRELGIFGQNEGVQALARTLALYVRQAAPLRCLVRAAGEDEILLDLGANDGMKNESTFQILRYPQNLRPVPVATVKLTKVDPFRAHAEVEEARPGMTVQPGDVAVEDTGDLAL
jgi:hypothetical protein